MNAKANLIVSRVCWIAMAIIAIGLIFGPLLCFSQVLGRPASESYVTSKINAHSSTNNAHADIRALVFSATTNVNALTIAATNATEAAHAATVQANAAILKNTQQDVDISHLYASNANTMAIMESVFVLTNAYLTADFGTNGWWTPYIVTNGVRSLLQ